MRWTLLPAAWVTLGPRQDGGEQGLAAGVLRVNTGMGRRACAGWQWELLSVGLGGEVEGHLAALKVERPFLAPAVEVT